MVDEDDEDEEVKVGTVRANPRNASSQSIDYPQKVGDVVCQR